MSTQPINSALAAPRRTPDAVLEWIEPGMDVIVGAANGEPVATLDAIEAAGESMRDVRLHQMIPLRPRRYIDGAFGGLRHVSWFLGPHNRAAFHRGDCDLVPNSFSDVPRLMRQSLAPRLVLATVSPPDRHGYFSLGANAEYAASFIGEVPFFVEVNPSMPRTFGGNRLHISDIAGYCEADTPLVELPKVVTEYGVAELRGSTIAERTRRLIAVAHPRFREELTGRARELSYLV
jgi:acyl-CoA hydrolase